MKLHTLPTLSRLCALAALILAPLAPARLCLAQNAAPPQRLRCEYLRNPLGVDTPRPRFFWALPWTGRDQKQTAFQILVAGAAETLAQNRGDIWDSGRVASESSGQIEYAGKALESGRTYFWKVRAWDRDGRAAPFSEPARFDTGLLNKGDWQGRWIGGGNQLRRSFTLPSAVVRARVYVTALGYYELSLNGHRIGRRVLDPAYTTYPARVLYSTYDVTALLQPGQNAIGAAIGGGWATLSLPAFAAYYPAPALLVQMNVEMADGKTMSVVTDGAWRVRQGPVVSDSVYDGEVYDARREVPGWDRSGFDDASWAPAKTVEGSGGARSAELMPAIQTQGELAARAMTNPAPGVYVYDFGQNMSGWAKLSVRGPAGTRVRMRYSELVYEDGSLNRENLRSARSEDVYLLRGGAAESYQPRFTYHGFRYVELTGYPGTPALDSVRAVLAYTSVETVGGFASSKPVLNDLQRIIVWSQRTNLFGIPTDCDQRDERQGWMADAQVTAEEAMDNFDMAAFYTNFIRDIRDAQAEDGAVPDTVPWRFGGRPSDPAWGTAFVELCWQMWRHYGDRRVLDDNYDALARYVSSLGRQAKDGLVGVVRYGDWVPVIHTPSDYVSALYYFHDVNQMAAIARVLGKTNDAAAYDALAQRLRSAILARYFDSATGNFANGTQTANAMALALGLAPKDKAGAVEWNLVNDIVYTHDTHLTTGFIGVKFLLPELTALGRSDVAYELATQTTYPSWGYMIRNGATTLWELWQRKEGPSMNSQDHPMFGSVGAWLYEAPGGIGIDSDEPGYRRLRIAPQMVEDLRWAAASIETLRGTVSCSWKRGAGKVALDVVVPVGSGAKVVIPLAPEMKSVSITESGRPVWQAGAYRGGVEGVRGASAVEGAVELSVASGSYSFELNEE